MTTLDYSAVFDAVPAACAVLSSDLVYLAVNRAYEHVVERPRGQLLGRRIFEVFSGGPSGEGVQELRASLERVLAEGDVDVMPLVRYDVQAAGQPGNFEERYWTAVNSPLLGPDGRVTCVVNRVEEITSYIQRLRSAGAAEEGFLADQVEATEAELFQRAQELQEANRRLRRAQRRERQATAAARAALRRQQQVVADTSHDLRRPLTGLQTRLQVALTDPQADSRQVLHAALQDAERLGDIVSDLLELARLEGKAPFPTEPVDLSALVEAELARSGLACATTVDITEGIVVEGSAVRLARLLANLLTNADRHATSLIHIKVHERGEEAFVEVIDDGPGIPADEREAVFQRFYRRADARRSDPEGTGLGLPIARQIARAHHGDLYVADHPSGTRMVLHLPRTSP
ncbi:MULTISPECIES: PAS domain-containing sensor histidine kinase [unclassified Actinomadura]|uniref:sensor histidine kinase n=1 Tax=unclassified Actinomadura TaxID=2626254 RepID=UPI0011EF0746|nr:PAS domain-containing sensor histidine kinase [Actinomadura sp. K4S16]